MKNLIAQKGYVFTIDKYPKGVKLYLPDNFDEDRISSITEESAELIRKVEEGDADGRDRN